MRLYEELETGAECERLAPTLVALAAGTATSEALLDLRPHLRNCPGCRATVRTLHASRLRRLTAFLPVGLVAPARAFVERFRGPRAKGEEAVDLRPMERQQELEEAFRRLNAGDAATQPIAPSVAEGVGRLSTVRINARGWVETALQRLQSSDVAMGIHTAASGGGGRVTSIAALIGICVSGVGAGTYCVATALLPDPKPAIRSEAKPAAKRKAKRARTNDQRSLRSTNDIAATATSARSDSHGRGQGSVPSRSRVGQRTPATRPDEFSFENSGSHAGVRPKADSASGGSGPPDTDFETAAQAPQVVTTSEEFTNPTNGEFSP